MKWAARVGFVLSLSILVAVLTCGVAMAYPAGWTSDNTVATGAFTVDVCSQGSNVWVAYHDATGIAVKKSTDKGTSFSAAVRVTTENSDTPQICVLSTGTLYCGYWRDAGINVKRSTDGGSSWTDFAWYNGEIENWSMTHNGDSPAIAWQMVNPASGYDDSYYSFLGAGGSLTATRASHNDNDNANQNPSIASDGTNLFIAFWTKNYFNGEDEGIWVTRVAGSTAYDQIYAGWIGYAYPSISWRGTANQFDVNYVRNIAGSNWVYSSGFNGSLPWGASDPVYNATSQNPYPKTIPCDGGDAVCRSSNGQDILRGTTAADTVIMQGVNPTNNSRSVAVFAENTTADVYVVATNGTTAKIKRTDRVDPTSTGIQVTGGNTFSGITYVKSNFGISYQNVVDDWNVTGTDPLGDAFTNGVSSIQMGWKNIPNPSTWGEIPTDKPSPLTNAPWTATVDISGTDDGPRYIHGYLTDTAGNEGEVTSGEIQIDKTPPTVDDAVVDPSGGGWHRTPIDITITGHDANLSRCQYRKGSGSWTDIASGGTFSVKDYDGSINYRAVDHAGNVSEEGLVVVHSDTLSPTISITHPATDTITASADGCVLLAAKATDANEVNLMKMYIDGRKIKDNSAGDDTAHYWDTTGKDDGTYTLRIEARDIAGNWGTATKRFNLISKETAYFDSYFAEGCTRDGFDEYLCILNPQEVAANLDLSFQLENGEVKTTKVAVPKTTRLTLNVADIVGRGHDVSTRIHADQVVVCERPMYFNYRGWTGGHTAPARNTLQQTFYFAEGCTRPGFETWLTLQNPGDVTANVTATYMLGTGENVNKSYPVAAHSRATVSVNNEVGPDRDVSIKLTSDRPVAAERPMYFNNHGWTGGHDVIGTTSPQTTWYFAEGTTRDGFEEWLCIQNPGSTVAKAEVKYSTGTKKTYSIKPHSRYTVNVNADVGPGKDVSATVTGDVPIIVERPMYFNNDGRTGGSAVLGANPLPERTTFYYLAEGTTREGFDEYLTIYNPQQGHSWKTYIEYVFPDGTVQSWAETHKSPFEVVSEGRRFTVNVADDVGVGRDVSIRIVSEYPVVVERPMYFNYRGWDGGHCGVPFVSQ